MLNAIIKECGIIFLVTMILGVCLFPLVPKKFEYVSYVKVGMMGDVARDGRVIWWQVADSSEIMTLLENQAYKIKGIKQSVNALPEQSVLKVTTSGPNLEMAKRGIDESVQFLNDKYRSALDAWDKSIDDKTMFYTQAFADVRKASITATQRELESLKYQVHSDIISTLASLSALKALQAAARFKVIDEFAVSADALPKISTYLKMVFVIAMALVFLWLLVVRDLVFRK